MAEDWRKRIKGFGETGVHVSRKVKRQIDDAAPEVSKRVRQQYRETAPKVSHRVREAGRALKSPPPAVGAAELGVHGASPSLASSGGSHELAYPVNRAADSVGFPAGDYRQARPPFELKSKRPVTIVLAYSMLIIAAVASAILAGLGVYGLTELRGSADKVIHLDPTGTAAFYANGYVEKAETWGISSAIALGVLFALAYALVAVAVHNGHRWPRYVGPFLAVLSLPAVFFGPVAVVVVLAGIVAVLALWTSSARNYAIQLSVAKRAARRS